MAKKKVKWNIDGFEEIRNDPRVRKVVVEKAEEIAREASENGKVEGYIVTDRVLQEGRAAASVMATGHANNHNWKNHALIKALHKATGDGS